MAGNGWVQIIVNNHLLMIPYIGHTDQCVQIVAVICVRRHNWIVGIAVAFLQVLCQRLHCSFKPANLAKNLDTTVGAIQGNKRFQLEHTAENPSGLTKPSSSLEIIQRFRNGTYTESRNQFQHMLLNFIQRLLSVTVDFLHQYTHTTDSTLLSMTLTFGLSANSISRVL